jgi:branched-chain amino acid transport system permease protein
MGKHDLAGLTATRRRLALTSLGVVVLATVPFTTTTYVTDIFFTGLVFVMLGVSWNIIAGYAGQISLGHAAFFGIGAYVSAWTTTPTAATLPQWLRSPALVALVIGALAAGLVALAIGPILFRLTGHYFAIGTLALAAIIQLVLLDQRRFSGGSTGYYLDTAMSDDVMYVLAFLSTVGIVVVTYWLVNSRWGLGMRAIHDDEGAASSLGVHPLRYKMYAFVASSTMAGLAGAFYAQYTLYINPNSTLSVVWMVDTLVVVILGGMGTMLGPVLGAGLFVALDNVLREFAGGFATTIEGGLIIAFIIFMPGGLLSVIRERSDGETADSQTETDDEREEEDRRPMEGT